jgi:hypothetical protein
MNSLMAPHPLAPQSKFAGAFDGDFVVHFGDQANDVKISLRFFTDEHVEFAALDVNRRSLKRSRSRMSFLAVTPAGGNDVLDTPICLPAPFWAQQSGLIPFLPLTPGLYSFHETRD